MAGLSEAFVFAALMCLIATAASWWRGDRYVDETAEVGDGQAAE